MEGSAADEAVTTVYLIPNHQGTIVHINWSYRTRVENLDGGAFGGAAERKRNIAERMTIDAVDTASILRSPEGINTVEIGDSYAGPVFDGSLRHAQYNDESNKPDFEDHRKKKEPLFSFGDLQVDPSGKERLS